MLNITEYGLIAKEIGSLITKEKLLIAKKNAFNAKEIKSMEQCKKEKNIGFTYSNSSPMASIPAP